MTSPALSLLSVNRISPLTGSHLNLDDLRTNGPVYDVDHPQFIDASDVDHTARFNRAIIAAAATPGGGSVRATPGVDYSALSIQMLSRVDLILRGARILKNGGAAASRIIDLIGATTATTTLLTGNATDGDTVLNVTLSAGFAVDDLVLVKDTTFEYGTSGPNQEQQRVGAVGAGTITLKGRLLRSYATASAASVTKLAAVDRGRVIGGELIVPVGTAGGGVYGFLTNRCGVYGTHIVGPADWPGVRWDQSRRPKIMGGSVRDGQSNTVQGTSYGYLLNDSTQNALVMDVETSNIRENPVSNGAIDCDITHCDDYGSTDSSWNTHGTGCHRIRFSYLRAFSPKQYGSVTSFLGNFASDTDITWSYVDVWRSGSSGFVSNGDAGKEPKRIRWIQCNTFGFGRTNAGSAGLVVSNVIDFKVLGGDYSGASIAANTAQGILLNASQKGKVLGATVRDIANGWGIQQQNGSDIEIENCDAQNISSNVFRSVLGATRITWRNNTADVNNPTFLAGDTVRGGRYGTKYDEDEGIASVADGGTIAHNCRAAPTRAIATSTTASRIVSITAFGATTITVAIKKDDGTADAVAQNVSWRAAV